MANEGYTTCQDCNRLLKVEHGPICVECAEKRGAGEPSEQPAE